MGVFGPELVGGPRIPSTSSSGSVSPSSSVSDTVRGLPFFGVTGTAFDNPAVGRVGLIAGARVRVGWLAEGTEVATWGLTDGVGRE